MIPAKWGECLAGESLNPHHKPCFKPKFKI
jgi:hypothetical protein